MHQQRKENANNLGAQGDFIREYAVSGGKLTVVFAYVWFVDALTEIIVRASEPAIEYSG